MNRIKFICRVLIFTLLFNLVLPYLGLIMPFLEESVFAAELQIDFLEPNIGNMSGGTRVEIKGENFEPEKINAEKILIEFGKDDVFKQATILKSECSKNLLIVRTPQYPEEGSVHLRIKELDALGGIVWEKFFPNKFEYRARTVDITGITPNKLRYDLGAEGQDFYLKVTNLYVPKPSIEPNNEVNKIGLCFSYGGITRWLKTENELKFYKLNQLGELEDAEPGAKADVVRATSKLDEGQTGYPSDFVGNDVDLKMYVTYNNNFNELVIVEEAVKFTAPKSNPRIDCVFDSKTGKNFGSLEGNNTVYIAGEDFAGSGTLGKIEIYFGGHRVSDENIDVEQGVKIRVRNLDGSIAEKIKDVITVKKVPPSISTGKVDVQVVNPDGAVAISYGAGDQGYTYRLGKVDIESISPDRIEQWTTDNKEMYLIGYNFAQYLTEEDFNDDGPEISIVGQQIYTRLEEYLKSNTFVIFKKGVGDEGVAANIASIKRKVPEIGNKDFIKVVIPDEIVQSPGEYELLIRNPYGAFTASKKFMVLPDLSKPEISKVEIEEPINQTIPLGLKRSGGDKLKIEGKNFMDGVNVLIGGELVINDGKLDVFGGKPATQVQVSYEYDGFNLISIIKAVAPAGEVGSVPLKIINPDGGSTVYYPDLPDPYHPEDDKRVRYLSQPVIEEVNPRKIVLEKDDNGEYKESFISVTGTDFIFSSPGQSIDNLQIDRISLGNKNVLVYSWQKIMGKDVILLRVKPQLEDLNKKLDLKIKNKDGGEFTFNDVVEIVYPSTSPQLNYISPSEGSCDDWTDALLMGSGFMSDIKVYFVYRDEVSGTSIASEANVESVNEAGSMIKIKVPPFPLPQDSDELTVSITIMNISKPGSCTLEDCFTYRRPSLAPLPTAIYPADGPASGGTWVTVTGFNFTIKDGKLPKLYFSDHKGLKEADPQDLTVWDSSDEQIISQNGQGVKIKAKLPPNTPGVKDVVVVNPDTGVGTLKAGFTYRIVQNLPELNLIIPAKGPELGGQKVNLYGAKFVQGANILFGTQQALNVNVINEGSIELTTPAGLKGKVDVTVINPDGGSSTLVKGYEYTATIPSDRAPFINAVVPGMGSTEGGTDLTIYGKNFMPLFRPENASEDESLILYVGNGIATDVKVYRYDSNNQLVEVSLSGEKGSLIKAKSPRGKAGTTYVAVLNPDGGYFALDNCYTYKTGIVAQPKLTSIVPSKGRVSGGTPLQLEGVNVSQGAKLFIGDQEATKVQVLENGTGENGDKKVVITAFTPQGSLGVQDVVVVNSDGSSYSFNNAFEYINDPLVNPKIIAINPNQGRTTGGTEVKISGSNFKSGQLLFIGGRVAATLSIQSSVISFKTPSGVAGPKDVYLVDSNDGGLAFVPNGFEYVVLGGPTISKIEPNKGLTKGGEAVTITGANFDQNIKVFIGGTSAQVERQSSTAAIIIKTPEKDIGSYDVTVENPDGTSFTCPNGFTYYGVPKWPGSFRVTPVGQDGSCLKLEWDSVAGADYYELFGRRRNDDSFQFLTSITETYYYVKGLTPDTWYEFKVRAINRYGASRESNSDWSYTSYDSWSNYIPPYNISGRVNQQGGSIIYTLGAGELAGSSQVVIDLSSYQDAKSHSLNIPASLVLGFQWREILFKTGLVHLSFTFRSLNGYEFMQLYPVHDDTYVKINISQPAKNEQERLLKYLPRNKVLASPILKIGGQVICKHKKLELTTFAQVLRIGLLGDRDFVGTNYTADFQAYYYDPAKMAWEPLGNKTTWYRSLSESSTMRTGYYVLLTEKR